jgi:opacity protein-like surface antigen
MEFWDKHKQRVLRAAKVVGFGVAFLAVVFVAAKMLQPSKARAESLLPVSKIAEASGGSTWSGFYIGAHGGKGWGDWDGNMHFTGPDAWLPPEDLDRGSKTISADGAIFGGQVGWNFQSGAFVWGIEADGSWSRIKGDKLLNPVPSDHDLGEATQYGQPDWGFSIRNDWLATVRGRLGVSAGSVLLYGTGGVAFGGFTQEHTVVGYPDPNGRGGRRSETETGWASSGRSAATGAPKPSICTTNSRMWAAPSRRATPSTAGQPTASAATSTSIPSAPDSTTGSDA